MDKEEAKKELESLREKLTKWSREYYVLDAPTVEDHVYDENYKRLLELEAKFPELVTKDSPSQRVGGRIEFHESRARNPDAFIGRRVFKRRTGGLR